MQPGVLHRVGHVISHNARYQSFASFDQNRGMGSSSWNHIQNLLKSAEEFGPKARLQARNALPPVEPEPTVPLGDVHN